MKDNKGKKFCKTIICIALVCLLIIPFFIFYKGEDKGKLLSIKSEDELYSIYKENTSYTPPYWSIPFILPCYLSALPIGLIAKLGVSTASISNNHGGSSIIPSGNTSAASNSSEPTLLFEKSTSSVDSSYSSEEQDYSKTNIQVENVDEADITKTDGDYIYSISENNVVITDVRKPENIKIASKFNPFGDSTPVDLILNNDKLAIILQGGDSNYSSNTIVCIYNIKNREKPKLQKSYSVDLNYYTSRCINNKLYIISNGYLKKLSNEKKINREYIENTQTKQIELENIKYMKGSKTGYKETIIATVDINSDDNKINVHAYLFDISNAYVSENNIYLADEKWNYYDDNSPKITSILGLKGLFGIFDNNDDRISSSKEETDIYKFRIHEGDIEFEGNGKTSGITINQYSMDEKDGHLRIATYDDDGTSISIFDEKMNKIGETEKLAKGEKMYSSRFIGNKAYLVTYKTIDPLFVVDLSNETNPKVLGELKISGYSEYLHPYDENHIIGIGMETQTNNSKDINGRVISSNTTVVGMKMALFDVSNVSEPKAISTMVIGDRRTTSAILTNPKALLFSKEKELLAIPINNYSSDFETTNSDDISSLIEGYKGLSKKRIGEGYAVYKINLSEGFKLKGMITHKEPGYNNNYIYNYKSNLLRGLYINKNLYTVSEYAVKVNDLENMNQIGELNLKY